MSYGSKNILEAMKKVFQIKMKYGGFDSNLSKLELLKCGDGKCLARLKVNKSHLNIGGVLHGGFTATLVDSVSTFALMTSPFGNTDFGNLDAKLNSEKISELGLGPGGASVNLNVSFCKVIKPETSINIEAETLKNGKNLAFLSVKIIDEDSGALMAKGEHVKYLARK